ncbi:DUF3718 domain-containing protein [Salinimonas sp. HHU 13199]|uniref:DUF3718 domain-containing protein n=1 Tax=Salinimonas profundi TaxID=2729140 RepID=A0ABR8LHC3_9ALTE|nr:DUF3718 domain-containing protein [Salinimonas profundi]MBD3584715.1 DUF3718 domain-containing protein [Salinimonas profundi]
MKLLNKKLLATSALLVLSHTATAGNETVVRYKGDTSFSGFCKAVVKDDVRILRSSIQRSVGNVAASDREVIRRITAKDGLTCNGSNLIEFSEKRNAKQVKSFLMAQI